MDNKKVVECSKLLAERHLKIAFAESATSGWLPCLSFFLHAAFRRCLAGRYDQLRFKRKRKKY